MAYVLRRSRARVAAGAFTWRDRLLRGEMVLGWQQLLLRPGVFQINRFASATIGYGFVNAYPYGSYPAKATLPEHRVFEQLWIKHSAGRIALQHRFRVEQRALQVIAPGTPKTAIPNYGSDSAICCAAIYALEKPLLSGFV